MSTTAEAGTVPVCSASGFVIHSDETRRYKVCRRFLVRFIPALAQKPLIILDSSSIVLDDPPSTHRKCSWQSLFSTYGLIGIDDVIQAGAGPTGLFLALTLLKNGVQVRVVDRDPNRHPGQRGSGIQVGIAMMRNT